MHACVCMYVRQHLPANRRGCGGGSGGAGTDARTPSHSFAAKPDLRARGEGEG